MPWQALWGKGHPQPSAICVSSSQFQHKEIETKTKKMNWSTKFTKSKEYEKTCKQNEGVEWLRIRIDSEQEDGKLTHKFRAKA